MLLACVTMHSEKAIASSSATLSVESAAVGRMTEVLRAKPKLKADTLNALAIATPNVSVDETRATLVY